MRKMRSTCRRRTSRSSSPTTISPRSEAARRAGPILSPHLGEHRPREARAAPAGPADAGRPHRRGKARPVASDRVAIPVPIAHMYGFGAAFVPAVLAGASIDLQPNANVLRYLAREPDFDPTVAYLAPSFGDALVRVRKAPRPYRLTIMAGDRLTGELFDGYEALHGRLVNLYGSTELGRGRGRRPGGSRRDPPQPDRAVPPRRLALPHARARPAQRRRGCAGPLAVPPRIRLRMLCRRKRARAARGGRLAALRATAFAAATSAVSSAIVSRFRGAPTTA